MMLKKIFFAIGWVAILLLCTVAFAQNNAVEKSPTSLANANHTFNVIQKKLSEHPDYRELVLYTQQLDDLQVQAKKCVTETESHLKIIGDLLNATQVDHVSQLQRADLQYLQSKQTAFAHQLSSCRLFVYRSQEALTGYKNLIQEMSAHHILQRGTPLWEMQSDHRVQSIYIILMGATLIWIFVLWRRKITIGQWRHGTIVFFTTVFAVILSILVMMEGWGYHRLAMFAIQGLCFTAIYTIALMVAWYFVDRIYQCVDNKKYPFSKHVHLLFGVKFNRKMHEITLVKIALCFALICFYIVLLLKSWSISVNFVDATVGGLVSGFKFLGMHIIPLRIILAMLAFSGVFLVGRLIATTIAKKQSYKGEEDTQIALATITIYISFAVALLFALLVTGVDFTGLAIIAGALSVGVGLGLQTIVNNFVSGLILLIEKPIKPGDRIVIGKTEGFVRKIRIRSTQISTLSKEDVIVPNADLITQQVTNYMFRDRNSRVQCSVGVAYGSDLALVKKTLLAVAAKNDDVVHEIPNDPVVLFSRFGDSALLFDLWCVIHDVNKKYVVVSDLNFAIDSAFREQGIVIAFPQREIRIREYPAGQPTS